MVKNSSSWSFRSCQTYTSWLENVQAIVILVKLFMEVIVSLVGVREMVLLWKSILTNLGLIVQFVQ